MVYKDRIYGKIEISQPIVLELIRSPSIKRLKGVEQAGYIEPHFPGTSFSRFEHSLGVYMLLKRYKASLEEQIAGLIHDVSHSVFSHCIDYVLDSSSEKEHNHQDNIFKDFVRKTEIPLILEKYKLDIDYILDESNFPLKERILPDLCADRIDYSLRTAVAFNEIGKKEVEYFLKNLTTQKNLWVFENLENAKEYAQLFFKLNSLYYAGLPSAIMFRTVGDYLKHALERKYINPSDLYTTDKNVLVKINQHLNEDKKLKLLFKRMNNKIKIENNRQNFDIRVFCKSRVVDPLCKYNNGIKRISEIDRNWAEVVEKESIPKEYFLKFFD